METAALATRTEAAQYSTLNWFIIRAHVVCKSSAYIASRKVGRHAYVLLIRLQSSSHNLSANTSWDYM